MSELLKQVLTTCTAEEKSNLLAELATEVFATRGSKGYSIQNVAHETVGFLTPGRVHPAALFPDDPSWSATIQKRIDEPGRTIGLEEFFKGFEEPHPEAR